MISVQIYPSTSELLEHLAPATVEVARASAGQSGLFAFALAGGTTPESFYRLLAQGVWEERFPWDDTVFFWGDERAVGPKDPKSNYRMAMKSMLERAPVPPTHILRMRGEEPDLKKAAADYQAQITAVLGHRDLRFDLVLLGMGEDGHTASLFPDSPAQAESERLVAENRDPDGAGRLTFTFPLINRAHNVFLLVTGERKAHIVKQIFTGRGNFPIRNVHPAAGLLTWWLDRAAAATLSKKDVEDYMERYREEFSKVEK
jgi:6-phosphogluconolactonase